MATVKNSRHFIKYFLSSSKKNPVALFLNYFPDNAPFIDNFFYKIDACGKGFETDLSLCGFKNSFP